MGLETYQGAVKKTSTGRDKSLESTLSANSFSVSIIFPPDLAIPSCVLYVLRSIVASDLGVIRIVCDADERTKASLLVKNEDRIMQIMEAISSLRFKEYFFCRYVSSTIRARLGHVINCESPCRFLCFKNPLILKVDLYSIRSLFV